MGIKETHAIGFRGMDNIQKAPGILLDDAKRITPRIALNVEVQDGGKLTRREGYSLHLPLPGAHSLWAGSVVLVASEGVLYRMEGQDLIPLCQISLPEAQICYYEADNLIYMSTPSWSAIYEVLTGKIRSWGVSLPTAPKLSFPPGNLPAGKYSICYTQAVGNQISGNGPIVQVAWEGDTYGIGLENLPVNAQCWITQPNGSDLFLAELENEVITGITIIPLPTFSVMPPLHFSHFAQAFGRMWGCEGHDLAFSDPFQYEWFRAGNFKPFIEELVMVAPVNEGIFVNSLDSTWFLDGTDPAKMTVKRIGDGAIPGTLVYAELPGSIVGGGYEMSRRLGQIPAPVWIGKHGVIIGTQTGHLVHLTQGRLEMPVRAKGSSTFRVKNGIPQILTVLNGPLAAQETAINSIFADGKLFE